MRLFETLIQESVRDPQKAARDLMALRLPLEIAGMALLASIAASVVLTFVITGLQPLMLAPGQDPVGPLVVAGLVAAMTVIFVAALVVSGRIFDGTGTMADGAVLIAWLQILLLLAQIVQVALALVSGLLAGIFGLISFIFVLWMTVHFTKAMHGFDGIGKSIVVFLMAGIIVTFVFGILTSMMGLAPEPTA